MAYIEGDGPKANLYHLLWQKEGPYIEKNFVHIPDTLIFVCGKPTVWYFTSLDGKVLKKRSQNLTYHNIIQKFTSKSSENDIVASFISTVPEKVEDKLLKSWKYENSLDDISTTPGCPIEFFTAIDFKKIFSNPIMCKDKTGILQYFVKPYGQHNEMIQAVWSPKLCIFTKKVNSRRLDEFKYGANERALTFEGPDYCSTTIPTLGKNIPLKIREACETIANHIINVSYEQISIQRLVAYFKVDENKRVYFLWAGSIRIKELSIFKRRNSAFESKPICLEPCVKLNKSVNQSVSKKSNNLIDESGQNSCISCDVLVSNLNELYPISLKLLIRYFDHIKPNISPFSLKLEGNDSSQILVAKQSNTLSISQTQKSINRIPKFIRKLYPDLKIREYYSLRDQNQFLLQTANVCQECFLKLTKKSEKNRTENNLSKNKLIRPQRPPSSFHSDSRSVASGLFSAARRKNFINQNLSAENILEITENDKTLNQDKSELIHLVAKARPHSSSKIPSETGLNSNASMTTLGSNLPSFLALRRSIFSSIRDSQSFLEKSGIEGQKSSPARLKNLNISEQLNEFAAQLQEGPSSLNEVQEKSFLLSSGIQITSHFPVEKIESLCQLKNSTVSRCNSKRSSLRKNNDDIEELLRASIENFSLMKTSRVEENPCEVTLINKFDQKENVGHENMIIDVEDYKVEKKIQLPLRKKHDTKCVRNIKNHVDQSFISAKEKSFHKETFRNYIRKNNSTTQIFLTKQYNLKSSQRFSRPSNNNEMSISLLPAGDLEPSKPTDLIINGKKNETSSKLDPPKDKENNQRSFQMKKVYLSQISISHRKKGNRMKKNKDMIFH